MNGRYWFVFELLKESMPNEDLLEIKGENIT